MKYQFTSYAILLVSFYILFVSTLRAQQVGDDHLRALIQVTPLLPVERIEIETNPEVAFKRITGASADNEGNIYVLHRPEEGDPVVVLDHTGRFLRSWGNGLFQIPHSIRVDPDGNVWTVDANTSIIYKFTPNGKILLQIDVGGIPDPSRKFCGASDIAFAEDGRLFVSDGYCNGRIIEYDAEGNILHEWGKRGDAPGEFNKPHGIAISPKGNVYVADRENGRVQWFDQEGTRLGQWLYGGQLYSIAFSRLGDLYISTDPINAPMGAESNVVKVDPATGKMLGRFEVRAHELSIAPDGTIVPATGSSQLLLFRPRK